MSELYKHVDPEALDKLDVFDVFALYIAVCKAEIGTSALESSDFELYQPMKEALGERLKLFSKSEIESAIEFRRALSSDDPPSDIKRLYEELRQS